MKVFPLLPSPSSLLNTFSLFFSFFNLRVSLVFLLQECGTDFNLKLYLHFNADYALGLKSVHFCLCLPRWFQYGLHVRPGRESSISADPPSCVILCYCVPGSLRHKSHWKTKCIADCQLSQPYFPLLYLPVHGWVFKLLISATGFYVFFVDSVMLWLSFAFGEKVIWNILVSDLLSNISTKNLTSAVWKFSSKLFHLCLPAGILLALILNCLCSPVTPWAASNIENIPQTTSLVRENIPPSAEVH